MTTPDFDLNTIIDAIKNGDNLSGKDGALINKQRTYINTSPIARTFSDDVSADDIYPAS